MDLAACTCLRVKTQGGQNTVKILKMSHFEILGGAK